MPLIAVDAMGGDAAPREIVEGAILAVNQGGRVVLVGDESRIFPLLEGRGVDIAVQHASEVITMEDDPARGIRDKKDASVAVAARMVSAGEADAMVSAGSTGAALASAAFLIGRLPGVKRPGIASVFPTGHVVVDLGANIECKPEHLLQFAVMGSALSTVYQGIERPRVGLLNIGEEDAKGRDLERQAFHLLTRSRGVNFIGNIEGGDLATDVADVIVTDGFTGNVLLKTGEGTGRFIQKMILETLAKPEYMDAVQDLIPAFMEIRQRLSAEAVGGAHLLGAKGVVVIAHGSSSRIAVCNAIEIAAEGVSNSLVDRIRAGIVAAEA